MKIARARGATEALWRKRRRQLAAAAPRGAVVCLGVSGGADSTALLYLAASVMRERDWTVRVLHVHHGLRGREADRDAGWVQSLCARLGVECEVHRVHVRDVAKARGVSVEMAAREMRHEIFRRRAKALGAYGVMLAHTLDDQAETLVLRWARGAGRTGLGGIRPIQCWDGVRIIHPMLGWRRREIESFLRAHRVEWREDRSNLGRKYLRNRVRHEVLPLLERELNPSLRETLARNAALWSEEDAWMESESERKGRRAAAPGGRIRAPPLRRMNGALRRRVLRRWIFLRGGSTESIGSDAILRVEAAILRAPSGRVDVGAGWSVEGARGIWRMVREAKETRINLRLALRPQGRLCGKTGEWVLTARRAKGFANRPERGIGVWPAEAFIFANRAAGRTLLLRRWKPGDRMRPWGAGGSAKIQDLLTRAGVAGSDRRDVAVLECEGEIIWLPGYRIAREWAVPDPQAPSFHLRLERRGPPADQAREGFCSGEIKIGART